MRARRTDPGRRDRIIDVTLDLIAEVGVAGLSHRKVADRADVPLGSMTYHFAGMDELLREAFSRFADRIATSFEARLAQVSGPEDVADAVVDVVHALSERDEARDHVLTYELYTLAAREPAFRALTTAWMGRSRRALERHVDARTARQVDALIEGLALHRALDDEPHDRTLTEDAVRKVLGAGGGHA